MMAMAGMLRPPGNGNANERGSGTTAPELLRPHATKGARYGRSDRVRHVDPLLVITNSEAGTADEENLAAALAVLRERTSVEVAATSNPGELDGVLHRAGSRPVVVAGGGRGPAPGGAGARPRARR